MAARAIEIPARLRRDGNARGRNKAILIDQKHPRSADIAGSADQGWDLSQRRRCTLRVLCSRAVALFVRACLPMYACMLLHWPSVVDSIAATYHA